MMTACELDKLALPGRRKRTVKGELLFRLQDRLARPNDEVNRPGRRQGGRRRGVIRPKGGYLQIVQAGSELNGVLGEIAGGTRGT